MGADTPTSKEQSETLRLIAIQSVAGAQDSVMLAIWRDARADSQALRAEVRADLADLRTDIQTLTERVSRIEGTIQVLFAARDPRDDAS